MNYGRSNVDTFQMMFGITTVGLIVSGDLPIIIEFLKENPVAFRKWSAGGQILIFLAIREFG